VASLNKIHETNLVIEKKITSVEGIVS
jgi:hypothetical protein